MVMYGHVIICNRASNRCRYPEASDGMFLSSRLETELSS
jgi:hypothetical protein